jgi:hypothetical protein
MKVKKKKTIAVDFDKTLAIRNSGDSIFKAGAPIPYMVNRVKTVLQLGHKVIIFTARAGTRADPVRKFLKDNGLPDLEITNVKTSNMDEFWDDKAFPVFPNTGIDALSEARILLAVVRDYCPVDSKCIPRIDQWIKNYEGMVNK